MRKIFKKSTIQNLIYLFGASIIALSFGIMEYCLSNQEAVLESYNRNVNKSNITIFVDNFDLNHDFYNNSLDQIIRA